MASGPITLPYTIKGSISSGDSPGSALNLCAWELAHRLAPRKATLSHSFEIFQKWLREKFLVEPSLVAMNV